MNIDFSIRHPEWSRMESRWQMAWDFWRGGIHVLNPDHDTMRLRVASGATTSDGIQGELATRLSDFNWVSHWARSYLWKHTRETMGNYENRCARQIHFPIFQSVINVYTAGILRTGAKREELPWNDYWENVDLCGTNIDPFIRQALAMALVFGRVHAITDRPNFENTATNRAEEIARNDRAYSYLVTPINLVDWALDQYGRFSWAVIREAMPENRIPGTKKDGTEEYYRVWYPGFWELWKRPGQADSSTGGVGNSVLISEGSHPCGEVPISTLWATRDSRTVSMACESPLADVLDLDRDILNKLSELDEIERMQSFSLLWLPEMEGAPTGPVDVSPFSAIVGSAEAGTPQYVSPDAAQAAGKWSRIQEKLFMTRQLAGVGRGRAEYSKEERSGTSITLESEDKRNQMAWWAGATEEFDNYLHSIVAKWEGRTEWPRATYSRDFDLKGIMDSIQELVQIKNLEVFSKQLLVNLVKPLVDKIMREHGATIEEIKGAMIELDNFPENEPVPEVLDISNRDTNNVA